MKLISSTEKSMKLFFRSPVCLTNTGVFQMETGIGYGWEWLHVTFDDMLFIPSANSVQVTSDLTVCACA